MNTEMYMNWCIYAVSIYTHLHRYGNNALQKRQKYHTTHIHDSLMNVRKSPLTRQNKFIQVSRHQYVVSIPQKIYKCNYLCT